MNIYNGVTSEAEKLIISPIEVPLVPFVRPMGSSSGLAVQAFGQGQIAGASYSVPAHGELTLDFDIKLSCITPENVQNITDTIKALLSASEYERFKEMEKRTASGGISFFGLFGWSGRGSYEKTKERMSGFGLSEENQRTIINTMAKAASELSTYKVNGTIYNRNNDYSVSGHIYAMVMDCQIVSDEYVNQQRYIGNRAHLRTDDGENIPVLGKLYEHEN
ncbi:hypothetical protein WOB64_02710 [Vibrio parahaemolyticus]